MAKNKRNETPIPEQKDIGEFIQERKAELALLRDKYPDHFLDEGFNSFINSFFARLLLSLLSEFLKTDLYKNLQGDIAIPLLEWMEDQKKEADEKFKMPNIYAEYLCKSAHAFKLKDFKRLKRSKKNRKKTSYLKEYKDIHPIVRGICKKRYNNTHVRTMDFVKTLSNYFTEEIVRKALKKEESKPSSITYTLLGLKYSLSPTTIHDYIVDARKEHRQNIETSRKTMEELSHLIEGEAKTNSTPLEKRKALERLYLQKILPL